MLIAHLTSLIEMQQSSMATPSLHGQSNVLIVLVPMHLAHWTLLTANSGNTKTYVDEHLSFPEAQKRYFKP
jgi:hypothetical protein